MCLSLALCESITYLLIYLLITNLSNDIFDSITSVWNVILLSTSYTSSFTYAFNVNSCHLSTANPHKYAIWWIYDMKWSDIKATNDNLITWSAKNRFYTSMDHTGLACVGFGKTQTLDSFLADRSIEAGKTRALWPTQRTVGPICRQITIRYKHSIMLNHTITCTITLHHSTILIWTHSYENTTYQYRPHKNLWHRLV